MNQVQDETLNLIILQKSNLLHIITEILDEI